MEPYGLRVRFPDIPILIGGRESVVCKSRPSTFLPSVNAGRAGEYDRDSQNRLFVLGLGFVGQHFARQLKKEGWIVSGTCTNNTKMHELENKGYDVFLFDANEPEWSVMKKIKYYRHLVVSIPPVPGIGDQMLPHEELLRRELSGGNLESLCYLSSTGVYGDCGGALVDEDYPARPTSESGKLRLAAEFGWLNLGQELGVSAQVLRLGGIYGPGRSAADTLIKQGELSIRQKLRKSKQFTSRVHVDDICQALKATMSMVPSRGIYNIVDDDPAPREEVFDYALNLIEKKWPGFIKENTSPPELELKDMKGGSRGNKRVSNVRMKTELGVKLLHPDYKSGLLSIIDQMEKPFSVV